MVNGVSFLKEEEQYADLLFLRTGRSKKIAEDMAARERHNK